MAAPDDEPAASPLDLNIVLTAVRYWWKIAAPTAVLLALFAAAAVVLLSRPSYTASAWLVIREKPEYLLNPQVMEDPRKFVQNQMELMRSPPVIDPVANRPDVFAAPELAGGDAAERLRRLLKIQSKGQSDFFVIQFTSQDPKKAALVVNEVAKAYLLLQDRDLSQRMEATIRRLEQQRAEQQQAIGRLRDEVQEKTKALTGVDPFAVRGGLRSVAEDALSPLHSQIVAVEIDQAMTAAQVQAEKDLLAKQDVAIAATDLEAHVQVLPEVVAYRRRIADTQSLLQEHERVSVNLSKNNAYQQLLKQQAADKAQLDKRLIELRALAKTELEKQARARRADAVAAMEKTLEAKKLAADILKERLKKERENQKVYKGETVELEFLRSDYESAARVFEAINSRIVAMRLEQHAPDRVMLFKEAVAPVTPDEALPLRRMGLAGTAAFLLPFALAVGIELLQRRVSSRRQLETAGKLSVVAEVTAMPRLLASRKDRGDVVNRELQLFEESIDGLRTHLLLAPDCEGLRTIAVTSAVSREGKTSVAIQLALSIARSCDAPTLLIDGDLRCPEIHRIFEIERTPGLAELLQGTCSQREAIETEYGPALHLLTAGKLSAVPHKLLGNEAFPRLLDDLKSRYRYIVIDTPPILPASESLMIARAADASVVCARRDFSRLEQVSEAHQRLRSAGARVAGTVLNGISPQTYVYRYGSYYYEHTFENEPALGGRGEPIRPAREISR